MDELFNSGYACFPNLMLDVRDPYRRGDELDLERTCPLRQAVNAGDLAVVKELIERDHYEINKPNNKGWTLLHEAAVADSYYEIFQYLLSVGAKPDFKIENGVSPLYVACKYGSIAIARDLIEAGCEVNCKFVFDYDYGRFVHCNFTALHIACTRRNPEIVELLIENNANVNAKDDMGRTPIHYAIDNANVHGIRMLIRAGADLLIKDVHGCSPLHYASMLGNLEIFNLIKFLYRDKSVLNDQTLEGLTCLMLACQFKHYSIAEELIKLGADTTIVDITGLLAAHMAAQAGVRLFRLVLQNTPEDALERYASYGPGLEKRRSLPCLIIESQYFECLEVLYKSGVSEAILKCPDKINGHLVSPIGFLLLYNNRWFDKEAKLQYLEFLLSYDFLIDPVYEQEEIIKEEYKCQMWVESIEAIHNKYLPKRINSVEAVVQMHSHLHRDCYCELFLSMILSKIAAPNKYLPCDSSRQVSLFIESAGEGFVEALGLLKYAEYVDPDDIMDTFLRQISGPKYNWAGHEERVIKFLLEKCTTSFMPLFLKLKNSITEPIINPNDRRKHAGLLALYEMAKSNNHVPSLKSMCRLNLRRNIRKEAAKSYESFPSYLQKILLPPSLCRYLLYNEDF